MKTTSFEEIVSAADVGFECRQWITMRHADDRLCGQMENCIYFVVVQGAFDAGELFDISLHERYLAVIAGAEKAGLRVRVADERDDARAGGEEVFYEPEADHAGCAGHEDTAILPKFIIS